MLNSCGDQDRAMEEQHYDWTVGDNNVHYYSSHQTPEYHTYDYVGPSGDHPHHKVPMPDPQTTLDEAGKVKHEFMLDATPPSQTGYSQSTTQISQGATTVFPANLTCPGLKMKTPSSMHAVDMDANELLKVFYRHLPYLSHLSYYGTSTVKPVQSNCGGVWNNSGVWKMPPKN